MNKIKIALSIILVNLILCGFITKDITKTKIVTFPDFHISLKCNSQWKKLSEPSPIAYNYEDTLIGKDGFLEIGCLEINGNIDDFIKKSVINQPFNELYGKKPIVVKLKIKGQEARLVFPSSDQSKDLNYRAIIYINYPSFINIPSYNNLDQTKLDNSFHICNYAYLTADKSHIFQICKTLEFIK